MLVTWQGMVRQGRYGGLRICIGAEGRMTVEWAGPPAVCVTDDLGRVLSHGAACRCASCEDTRTEAREGVT